MGCMYMFGKGMFGFVLFYKCLVLSWLKVMLMEVMEMIIKMVKKGMMLL